MLRGGFFSSPRLSATLLCATLCCATFLHAATLRTLDGRTLHGDLQLLPPDILRITPPGGSPIDIPLDHLLEARFADPAPAAAPQRLPAPWVSRDIGEVRPRGRATWSDDRFTLRTGGESPSARRDSLHLVFQPLFGDGQITARIVDLKGPDALAGVMMRDSIEPNSLYVMLAISPRGLFLAQRAAEKKNPTLRRVGDLRLPAWLRITRNADRFTFAVSPDGQSFRQLAQVSVNLGDTVGVGLSATAARQGALATAIFDRVTVQGRHLRAAPDTAAPDTAAPHTPAQTPLHEPAIARGVQRIDGSMLDADLLSADADTLTLSRDGRRLQVPLARIARLILADLDADTAARLDAAPPGVLLRNGDFFEGDLRDLRDGRLTLSSILFGLRTFKVPQQAIAVILAPLAPAPARYVIHAAAGRILHAEQLTVGAGYLAVTDPDLGEIRLPQSALRTLRAAGGRLVPLATLLKSPPPAPDHPLSLSTAKPMELRPDARYAHLLAELRVPDTFLPTTRLQCTILADGKEIYRSPELTCLDDPQPLALDLAGVQSLTLQLHNLDNLPHGTLLISDPLLVRP